MLNLLLHFSTLSFMIKLIKAPFVCNACSKSGCQLDKVYYRAAR